MLEPDTFDTLEAVGRRGQVSQTNECPSQVPVTRPLAHTH